MSIWAAAKRKPAYIEAWHACPSDRSGRLSAVPHVLPVVLEKITEKITTYGKKMSMTIGTTIR